MKRRLCHNKSSEMVLREAARLTFSSAGLGQARPGRGGAGQRLCGAMWRRAATGHLSTASCYLLSVVPSVPQSPQQMLSGSSSSGLQPGLLMLPGGRSLVDCQDGLFQQTRRGDGQIKARSRSSASQQRER